MGEHVCCLTFLSHSRLFVFGQWLGTSNLHSAGVMFRLVLSVCLQAVQIFGRKLDLLYISFSIRSNNP
jgi:hypothetical protein